MDKIKVILIDDHQIVRDCIKALIKDVDDIDIVGEMDCGEELLNSLPHLKPDILLLDISMPGMSGLDICAIVQKNYPEIKVIILSMYTEADFIHQSVKNGIKAYLPKNTTKKELINAIYTVMKGGVYFNNEVSHIMLNNYMAQTKTEKESEKISQLSAREMEVLMNFAAGFSNNEIADKLHISIRTVETHKNNIMHKLEIKTSIELVKFCIKNKLIEL